MEAHLRLLRQWRQNAGVVHDDERVAVGRVLEVEEQPFLLKQPHDEVTVAFAVLSDVAVWLERTTDAELVFRETFIATKDLPDHLLYGLILIDLRVIALRNQAQP
ncbi:hypothetical protein D3C76_937740 [compost metagenome]